MEKRDRAGDGVKGQRVRDRNREKERKKELFW